MKKYITIVRNKGMGVDTKKKKKRRKNLSKRRTTLREEKKENNKVFKLFINIYIYI